LIVYRYSWKRKKWILLALWLQTGTEVERIEKVLPCCTAGSCILMEEMKDRDVYIKNSSHGYHVLKHNQPWPQRQQAANNEAEPASPPQLMPHLPTTTTNVHEIGLQSQVNVPVSVYNKANMFVPIIANSSYPCCFTLIMIEVQVLETNHGWSSAGIGTSSNQVGYLITPVIYPLTGTYNKRNKFED